MTKTDEQDPLVHLSENSAAASSQHKKLPPIDSDENLRAVIAHYEAKIDEVADLVTTVRHEINNPLTGVLGQAQLLLREDLSEKARKRVETIEALAIRLRDVVARLRDVQKTSKP